MLFTTCSASGQSEAEMFKMMMQYSKLLPMDKEMTLLYYKVIALTVLECSKNKLKDCLHLIMKLQVMSQWWGLIRAQQLFKYLNQHLLELEYQC